jgi:hypothetical protein
MSKHKAAVIPFPCDEDEESWSPKVINEWTKRAKNLREYIESGYMGVGSLLKIQQETYETLNLYWLGLPPRRAENLVKQLAPQWAELDALMARNRENAKRLLDKQRKYNG